MSILLFIVGIWGMLKWKDGPGVRFFGAGFIVSFILYLQFFMNEGRYFTALFMAIQITPTPM